MKLLQIGASWFPYQFSGLERYYAELVVRLPALGAEVIGVVSELQDPPQVEGLTLVPFAAQKKNLVRKFLDQRRIMNNCLHDSVDLVVSHCTPSLFPSLTHLGDKPLVCHFHGPRYLERIVERAHPLSVQVSKYIEHKVYKRTQHIVTLSRYMKHVLVHTYAFPEDRITVIPGGVNIDHFSVRLSRQEARQRLELTLDRPIVLTVRRLERRMGLDNLIDAMRDVVRACPDVLLLIAGKGPLQQELEHYISSNHLSPHIRMLGAVSDGILPLLYRAADLFILPTVAYEGFGLILIEALAAGTPALGTPVGAIPEVLGPLSQSLLLEGTSPRHLADGIQQVLSGRRVLPSMQACEAYSAANYAWPTITRQVHALYRDVLDYER